MGSPYLLVVLGCFVGVRVPFALLNVFVLILRELASSCFVVLVASVHPEPVLKLTGMWLNSKEDA